METNLLLNFSLIEEDDSVEISVEAAWDGEPDTPGCRSGHPDNWTPNEAGYTSIISLTVIDDVPEAKLKAGDDIKISQVEESKSDIERMVVEGYDSGDDFEEPDDDYYEDDPSHDYLNF